MDLEEYGFIGHRANLFAIVVRASNLQEAQNRFSLDWIEFLPLDNMHIIQNIMFPRVHQWDEEAKMDLLWGKFRESEPKLNALSLHECPPLPFGRFTKGRYVDGLVSITRSSSKSLGTLELDYGATLDLEAISDRLPPLNNVTKLNLNISKAAEACTVHEFPRRPLASICPNVTTTVSFFISSNVQSFGAGDSQLFPWTTVTMMKLRSVNTVWWPNRQWDPERLDGY